MTHLSVMSNYMEADITSQAVGLGTNTDFSFKPIFTSRYSS